MAHEPDHETLCKQAAARQMVERTPADDRLSDLADKLNLGWAEITGELVEADDDVDPEDEPEAMQ